VYLLVIADHFELDEALFFFVLHFDVSFAGSETSLQKELIVELGAIYIASFYLLTWPSFFWFLDGESISS